MFHFLAAAPPGPPPRRITQCEDDAQLGENITLINAVTRKFIFALKKRMVLPRKPWCSRLDTVLAEGFSWPSAMIVDSPPPDEDEVKELPHVHEE